MNDSSASFKHKVAIPIRFKDGDVMGHVNNANYLTFIEIARLKYFEEALGPECNWSKQQGIILAHASIDFKAPLFIEDTVFVYTRCSRLGNKSLDLNWLMVRVLSGVEQIVAQGNTVLASYDYSAKTSIAIPTDYRTKIEQFEGKIMR